MGNSKLLSRDFKSIGLVHNTAKSLATEILHKHYKHSSKEEKLSILKEVLSNYESYRKHEHWSSVIARLFPTSTKVAEMVSLKDENAPYNIIGADYIEKQAIKQLEDLLKLPVVEKAALMPDAHVGYGMPIGGVLATRNAVLPHAVGMDIGCRMSMSIFAESDKFLNRYQHQIKVALKNYTHFGMEGGLEHVMDHEVLDRNEFSEIPMLKPLHKKAWRQLGSSGSGNHFVEFGVVKLLPNNSLGLAEGQYLALLTHSGSRGLGAAIAQHYTQKAMSSCVLPKYLSAMAWLDLGTEVGQEYWKAMNLAGDYAKANHECIHTALVRALGLSTLHTVENHHNFAWKESIENEDYIIHRKGATPAHKGTLGIIPGSMANSGFLVEGLGNTESLNSASHGAGRKFSRAKAKETFTMSYLKKLLSSKGISLIGGSVEEAPEAYKDIHEVISVQKNLVRVIGEFQPKIVRMNHE